MTRSQGDGGRPLGGRTPLGDRAGRVEAVVFDVGETLIDDTRLGEACAEHLGVPRLTLFTTLGAFIANDEHHDEPVRLFRPGLDVRAEMRRFHETSDASRVSMDDLYPDAIPCLKALRTR